METSWQNELRKYWRVIENETEMLLTRDCIKDHMLFNVGFKNDLIKTVDKRIADTYERFLENTIDIRQIALRNGFGTNVNEQQNPKSEVISSENVISSTKSCGTSTRQPNQSTISNNAHDTDQTPAPSSSNEQRTIWTGKLNCRMSMANNATPSKTSIIQSESSNAKKSAIVPNTGQQVHSTIDDILNVSVSISEHSNARTPNTVAKTNCNFNHDQTLADLDFIICQAANSGNSLGQKVQSNSSLDQLQKVLESCLGTLESAVNNTSTNAELNDSREIKLEQVLASEAMAISSSTGRKPYHADSDVQVIGSTDPHFQTIDLTLESDVGPSNTPSVIVTPGHSLNNSNKSNTQTKKRKHVTFVDVDAPGKKQKVGSDSNVIKQLNFDMSSADRQEISTMDNNAADNSNGVGYKCTICAKVCSRNSKLEAHMKTHETDIIRCRSCNQKFTRLQENAWKSHEEQCKSKQFECYVCKTRRHSKKNLLVHIRQHTGIKPFKCADCPKCFASQQALSGHLKKDHNKGKQATVNVKRLTK